jgi:hypothetical protein
MQFIFYTLSYISYFDLLPPFQSDPEPSAGVDGGRNFEVPFAGAVAHGRRHHQGQRRCHTGMKIDAYKFKCPVSTDPFLTKLIQPNQLEWPIVSYNASALKTCNTT